MVGVSRLCVVSHAGVVAANRGIYDELARRGVDVELVVPSRWRNEYAGDLRPRTAAPGAHLRTLRVVGRGRPQRHVYLARTTTVLRGLRPEVLLVEEEPFSLAALQWSRAAKSSAVPYGLQVAETLERPMPALARAIRRATLPRAAFVVARLPSAAYLARAWGARGEVGIVPHSVAPVPARPAPPATAPTIGFVGRLVEAKGIEDLLAAVSLLDESVRLLVAGDGPLRDRVRAAPGVTWLGGLAHGDVDRLYDSAHVVCVPSRTTPTWVEQFGRVVIEALCRGVPVVAARTGELPWVLGTTGGGVLVDERDPGALAGALASLLEDPVRAAALGAAGREGVLAHFSDEAAASALTTLLDPIS